MQWMRAGWASEVLRSEVWHSAELRPSESSLCVGRRGGTSEPALVLCGVKYGTLQSCSWRPLPLQDSLAFQIMKAVRDTWGSAISRACLSVLCEGGEALRPITAWIALMVAGLILPHP